LFSSFFSPFFSFPRRDSVSFPPRGRNRKERPKLVNWIGTFIPPPLFFFPSPPVAIPLEVPFFFCYRGRNTRHICFFFRAFFPFLLLSLQPVGLQPLSAGRVPGERPAELPNRRNDWHPQSFPSSPFPPLSFSLFPSLFSDARATTSFRCGEEASRRWCSCPFLFFLLRPFPVFSLAPPFFLSTLRMTP